MSTSKANYVEQARILSVALRKPFDQAVVETRSGKRGEDLDYIAHETITERLLDVTDGEHDYRILQPPTLQNIVNRDGEIGQFYQCTVEITIPGQGTRSGVGTALALDENAPKIAESDAYKRAAMRFGVALDLHLTVGELRREDRQHRSERARSASKTSQLPMTEPQESAILRLCATRHMKAPDMEGWTQGQAGKKIRELNPSPARSR